ncbi:MAG: hypothetical protein K6U74_19330 [Firmicutes bacterium]|nr:hypothetical protein [Bacillota bacterium]
MELLGYIKIVNDYYGENDYIFFPECATNCKKRATNKQLQWLAENYEKLSSEQKRCLDDYVGAGPERAARRRA